MNHNVREDIRAQATDIAAAIRNLQPNEKHRKSELLSLLYPVILEMLAKNVTQKSILKLLEEKGLKLHPSRFKELMAAQANANGGETTAEENAE